MFKAAGSLVKYLKKYYNIQFIHRLIIIISNNNKRVNRNSVKLKGKICKSNNKMCKWIHVPI